MSHRYYRYHHRVNFISISSVFATNFSYCNARVIICCYYYDAVTIKESCMLFAVLPHHIITYLVIYVLSVTNTMTFVNFAFLVVGQDVLSCLFIVQITTPTFTVVPWLLSPVLTVSKVRCSACFRHTPWATIIHEYCLLVQFAIRIAFAMITNTVIHYVMDVDSNVLYFMFQLFVHLRDDVVA